jgi:hypothetical protein
MPLIPVSKPPKPPKAPVVPLDSTYLSNIAADQYQRNNQLAGLAQQGSVDQADTAEALRRMAIQRQQSQQAYNSNAARQGSLLSGRAVQGYGRMDTGYQQRGNDVQDQLARRLASRQQQAAEIQGGASIYDNQQQAASARRAADLTWLNRLPRYLGGIR